MLQKGMKKTFMAYGLVAILIGLIVAFAVVSGDLNLLTSWPTLLAVGVMMAGAYWFDDFGAICLLLAFMPFSRGGLEFEISIVTFNVYTIGVISLSVMAVLSLLMRRRKYFFSWLDVTIILLAFNYMASTLLAIDVVESGYIAFHAIFIPVISYFVLKTYVTDLEEYEQLTWFYIIGCVGIAISAIVVFVLTGRRAEVFGMLPIGLAGIIITGIIAAITSGAWRTTIGKVVVFIMLIGLLATFSRVYLLLLPFAPLFYKQIRKGRSLSLFSAVMILSLVATLFLAAVPDRFVPTEYDKTQENTLERVTNIDYWAYSLLGRGFTYKESLKKFSDKPIMGWGFSRDERVRHSIHMELLEYGGLIGYLLYTSIFLIFFVRVNKVSKNDPVLAGNSLIVLVVYINAVTNPFSLGMNPYLVFIFIALSEARIQMLGHGTSKAKDRATDSTLNVTGSVASKRILYRRSS